MKRTIRSGGVAIGTFCKFADAASIEIIAHCGFDFAVIDNEHTSMSKETMVHLIRAANIHSLEPIVRIRDKNVAEILQPLDAGASGVQVPQVDTKAEAEAVVSWVKYAPEGVRGYAASQRSAGYGFVDPRKYAESSNANTLVVAYCETALAVKNLDEILTVDGVDVIFIGPFDLSQAFGVIGQPKHKKVLDAMQTVIDKTLRAGKVVGTIAGSAEEAKELISRGVKFIILSSDMGMMAQVGKSEMSKLASVRG